MRVHVLNRSATKSLRGKTPCECWYGRKPNVSNFRTFGSLVHVKVTGNLGKLEDRSKEMIFVGYEHGSKAYRCLDHASLKLCISRDVLFEDSTSLSFSINNPGISISYEDFNIVVFQPPDEDEVEKPSEIPQNDPI